MEEEKIINKIRETIKLTSDKLRDLVYESYLVIDEKDIPIEEIQKEYNSSGRHQEYWTLVFKRLSDNKFFRIRYSKSVKDTMGWDECNYGPFEAIEVFPEIVSKTIYK